MSRVFRPALKVLFGVLLFAGLPLLGWGISDLRAFAQNEVRLAYVAAVVVLQILMVFTMPEIGRNRGAGTQTVQQQRVTIMFLQVLSLAIIMVAPFSDRRGIATFADGNAARYLGLVLFVLGFGVMNLAEATLGKQFSIQVELQDGHMLITKGLYRHVRHPRYSGIIMYNIGFSLLFRSWLGFVLVAALSVVLLWRIRDEEALLRQEFQAEWQDYAARSWRLVPFVY
jgi:protein-S-isoprenylcysteine O-methyltransferase Ste14